jgi:hypothetical protein
LVTSAENINTGHYPDITEHFSSHKYRSQISYNSRLHHFKIQNSSVSKLIGYRLMVMVQSPVQSFIIQTSSRTHPTSYSKVIFFYYGGGGTKSLGTAATSGLLYKPQMIDEDDFWSNWWNELAGETEVLGENLPPHDQTWAQTPDRRGGNIQRL